MDRAMICKFSVRRIELVKNKLIDSQVGDDGKAIIRRENRRVRVRAFLTRCVRSSALMLDEVGHFSERAIWKNWIECRVPAAVICRDQPIASSIELQMTGPIAAAGLMIKRFQTKWFLLNLKSPNRT